MDRNTQKSLHIPVRDYSDSSYSFRANSVELIRPRKSDYVSPETAAKHYHQSKKTHQVARHKAHHERQRSKTLHRKAVTRPEISMATKPINQLVVPFDQLIQIKSPKHKITDQQKLYRSQQVRRSQLIQRFNPNAPVMEPVMSIPVRRQANSFTQPEPAGKPNPFDTAVARATSHLEKSVDNSRNKMASFWQFRSSYSQ